ncbi:unnamed protein product [Sphagnum balticum]
MSAGAVSDAMSIFCGVANFRLRDVGGESFVDVDILYEYRIDEIPAVPRGLNMSTAPDALQLYTQVRT